MLPTSHNWPPPPHLYSLCICLYSFLSLSSLFIPSTSYNIFYKILFWPHFTHRQFFVPIGPHLLSTIFNPFLLFSKVMTYSKSMTLFYIHFSDLLQYHTSPHYICLSLFPTPQVSSIPTTHYCTIEWALPPMPTLHAPCPPSPSTHLTTPSPRSMASHQLQHHPWLCLSIILFPPHVPPTHTTTSFFAPTMSLRHAWTWFCCASTSMPPPHLDHFTPHPCNNLTPYCPCIPMFPLLQ